MIARAWLLIVAICAAGAVHAQTADEWLTRAEWRVRAIDSANRHFNGSFVQTVRARSDVAGDTTDRVDSFAVVVHEGIQQSRTGLSAHPADRVQMPPNSTSVFALRNVVFPFRVATRARRVDVNVRLLADTTIANRSCVVIGFDYHAESDSAKTRGAGRIWIARDDATPLQSSYDLQGRHPRRGDFLSSVTVHTGAVGNAVIVRHNATTISFALDGRSFGAETTDVVNANFHID